MINAWVYKTFDKALADSFDDCNWNWKRLIGIENALHYKSGKPKTMVDEFEPERLNVFPKEILDTVDTKKKSYTRKHAFGGTCGVCELAVTEQFPESSNRHQHLIPNFVAIMPESTWQQCADTQKKNIAEFQGWANIKPEFNCIQLQAYAKKHGYQSECDNCLFKVEKITSGRKELAKLAKIGWRL